jgi:hypothetical protein
MLISLFLAACLALKSLLILFLTFQAVVNLFLAIKAALFLSSTTAAL